MNQLGNVFFEETFCEEIILNGITALKRSSQILVNDKATNFTVVDVTTRSNAYYSGEVFNGNELVLKTDNQSDMYKFLAEVLL